MKTETGDSELAERLKSGDERAQREFIEKYGGLVFSRLIQIIGNRSDAEEVWNDVFYEALTRIESYDGRVSLKTWLWKLSGWRASNFLRRKAKEPQSVPLESYAGLAARAQDFDPAGQPDESFSPRATVLKDVLLEFPQEDVALLYMDAEGLGPSQIAARYGSKPGTVACKIRRLKKRLRRRLLEFEEFSACR